MDYILLILFHLVLCTKSQFIAHFNKCNPNGPASFVCHIDESSQNMMLPRLNPDIVELTINGGRFRVLQGGPFEKFLRLQSLWIVDSDIEVIKNTALEGLESLKIFTISSKLRTIRENVFRPCAELEMIDLSFNQISELYPFAAATAHLQHLQKLYFFDNPTLEIIEEQDLIPLTNSPLRYLDIARCNLRRIEKGALMPLKNLTHLYMSVNPLTAESLANALYNISPNLRVLWLNYLNLSEIPSKAMGYLSRTRIEDLSFKYHKFRHIPPGSFPPMRYLIKITLSHGNLEWIDGSVFESWPLLENLDLSYNRLTQLPLNSPIILTNLVHLDVSHNQIHFNQEKPYFFAMPNLVFLDMRHNRLTKNPLQFESLTQLESLQLSYNSIVSWKSPVISGKYMELARLFLSDNELTTVTPAMLADFKELEFINLHFNPFNCTSCDMYHFARWVNHTNYLQYVRCKKPEGIPVIKMKKPPDCHL